VATKFNKMTASGWLLYCYVTTPDQIVIEATYNKYITNFYPDVTNYQDSRVVDANKWGARLAYGTNGSFYFDAASGQVVAMHIFNNDVMWRRKGNTTAVESLGGDNNTDSTEKLDVLYFDNTNVVRVNDVPNRAALSPPYLKWAIGGVDVRSPKSNIGKHAAGQPTRNVPRTGIGYRLNNGVKEIVLFAAFGTNGKGGPTMYQMNDIFAYCGCSEGLCIDGGGSTMVSYRNSAGTNGGYTETADISYYRPVPTIIRLADSGRLSCTWPVSV